MSPRIPLPQALQLQVAPLIEWRTAADRPSPPRLISAFQATVTPNGAASMSGVDSSTARLK